VSYARLVTCINQRRTLLFAKRIVKCCAFSKAGAAQEDFLGLLGGKPIWANSFTLYYSVSKFLFLLRFCRCFNFVVD
jgi:hypothetical protein